MPRPKRTKVAPSIPASRVAKSNIRPINPKNVVEDISDEEEGRSATRTLSRSRGRLTHQSKDTTENIVKTTMATKSVDALALDGMRKRRDAAMDRLDYENNTSTQQAASTTGSSPAVELGRRALATPAAENSLLAVGNFRRRTRQPSILGRKDSRARSSSVESNLAESNGLTNIPIEGSVLARGTMRRRQRQPSILGRAPSRVRSSSVGLEMDRSTPGTIDSAVRRGALKRRSRQPSILGTKKPDDQRTSAYDYDDEDDFNPDDESTPLNFSKTRPAEQQGSQSLSSAGNPRKRKLSSLSTARSSPVRAEENEAPGSGSLASSSPNPVAQEVPRLSTPEPLSDTMASPRSSSSSPTNDSPEVQLPSRSTNLQARGRPSRRQPVRKPLVPPREESLPSSPPSLTHSPNQVETSERRGRAPTRPRTHPANLSTIQLQALLPRRRRRHARDTFDIESSDDGELDTGDLGSDDDELTHLTTRTNHNTRSALPRSVSRLKPGPSIKSNPRTTPAIERIIAATKRTNRSRKTTSDKENESEGPVDDDLGVDPDDSLAPIRDSSPEDSEILEERVGKELKTAKRKFEVVDKWELEFEDFTAGSSSPWDAR